MTRIPRAAALLLLMVPLGAAAPAELPKSELPKPELRCGWIVNPTPANWWLTDRDGQWVIGTQGGDQAKGMDLIPDLTVRNWKATNGSYGYGCGCMKVDVDRKAGHITRIYSVRQKPLAACRTDKALPRPED